MWRAETKPVVLVCVVLLWISGCQKPEAPATASADSVASPASRPATARPPEPAPPALTSEQVQDIVTGKQRPREITRGAPDYAALANLGAPRPDPQREWTVIGYFNADCNLEQYVLKNFNQIEKGLPVKGVEAVVLLDRHKQYDRSDGDWTDARVLRAKPDADLAKINSEVLARPGEVDLGNPRTLSTFVTAAMKAFPAKHYALLLSAHGSGWKGMIGDDDPAGDRRGGSMSAKQLAAALEETLRATNVSRFDLVSFDLCLMSQVELASELKPLVEVMVASEAMVPGHGFPYDKVMPLFASTSARDVAKGMVKEFGELCERSHDTRATMSACDLSQTDAVVGALNKLIDKLQVSMQDQWPAITKSMFFAETYMGRGDYRNEAEAIASVDLLDMLRRMRAQFKSFPAEAEYQVLTAAVKKQLLASYSSRGRRLSNGLAVYAPFRPTMLNQGYGQLQLSAQAGWFKLLTDLHQVQKQKMTTPKITGIRLLERDGTKAAEMRIAGGQNFEITVEGTNILWTTVSNVERVPQGWAVYHRAFVPDSTFDERKKKVAEEASDVLDYLMPQYVDGKNVLKRPAAGMHYRLTNGKQVCSMTLDVTDPGDIRHGIVPAVYSDNRIGTVSAELYVDLNWLNVEYITGYQPQADGRMMPIEITPTPTAKITPYYQVEKDDGTRRFMPAGTLTMDKGLWLIPFFFDPGTYAVIAEVESVGGSSTRKVFQYTLKGSDRLTRWTQAGGLFTAADLAGKWEWQTATYLPDKREYSYAPNGLVWDFKLDPKVPDRLKYAIRGKDEAATVEGIADLNTWYLPHVNMYTRVDPAKATSLEALFLNPDDQGYLRSDFYITFLLREKGAASLMLWDPSSERISRAVRSGPAPLNPAPAAKAPLVGTWQTADGKLQQVLTENTYIAYRNGKVVDQGVYYISGEQLITRGAQGRQDVEKFRMPDEKTLVIISAGGKETKFGRKDGGAGALAAPAPPQQAPPPAPTK